MAQGDEGDRCLEDLVAKEDPSKLFVNVKKIGEGCACRVPPCVTVARTFGEVFVGLDIRSLEKVAIKKMNLEDNYEEDIISEISAPPCPASAPDCCRHDADAAPRAHCALHCLLPRWRRALGRHGVHGVCCTCTRTLPLTPRSGGTLTDILELHSLLQLSEPHIALILLDVRLVRCAAPYIR